MLSRPAHCGRAPRARAAPRRRTCRVVLSTKHKFSADVLAPGPDTAGMGSFGTRTPSGSSRPRPRPSQPCAARRAFGGNRRRRPSTERLRRGQGQAARRDRISVPAERQPRHWLRHLGMAVSLSRFTFDRAETTIAGCPEAVPKRAQPRLQSRSSCPGRSGAWSPLACPSTSRPACPWPAGLGSSSTAWSPACMAAASSRTTVTREGSWRWRRASRATPTTWRPRCLGAAGIARSRPPASFRAVCATT